MTIPNPVNFLFRKSNLKIGSISIDASLSEVHSSSLKTTDNPVENGFDATDHAQIEPKTLQLECVLTDVPIRVGLLDSALGIFETVKSMAGKNKRAYDNYEKLLELQKNRTPITITTGLKSYDNMLIENIMVDRDSNIGDAIKLRISLKEIKILNSKNVKIENLKSDVLKRASSKVDTGSKTTSQVSSTSPLLSSLTSSNDASYLSQLFGR